MKSCAVLLSTYNGENYLTQLIESVLAQKNVELNLIVRDDGSSDKTIEILNKYQSEGKLEYYYGKNLRPARSFMDLVFNVDEKFDYYAFCDQDDYWKPEKLISAIQMLENGNPEIPMLYNCALEIVDKDLNFIRESFRDNQKEVPPLYSILMQETPGCTFVFNRALLAELRKFKPHTISMHDTWVALVCLAAGGKYYSDKNAYIKYRQHEANVVGSEKQSFSKRLKEVMNDKGEKRSDMCQELFEAYKDIMMPEVRDAFYTFSNYNRSFKCKMRILRLKYYPGKAKKRAFRKAKAKIFFKSL